MVIGKSILYITGVMLFLSACSIQSRKLVGTAWIIDLEAYADREKVPKGLDKGTFCIEFEQDSAFSGSIYKGLDEITGDTVWYYLGNYRNKIDYDGRQVIDYLSNNEKVIMTVEAHKAGKYLYMIGKRKGQEKVTVHLKPAPEFDRNNIYKVSEEVQRQFREAVENGRED